MNVLSIRPALFMALFAGLMSNSARADFEKGIAAYQADNLPLARKEFFESAEKGHMESQFNLAVMFEQGIGGEKDEAQALEWYSKSAAQGNAGAQFNLGVLYENGRGTPVDFAQANAWYRKAALQGDAMAIGNLGMLYLRGDGVKESKIAGVALLLVSATLDASPENFARRNLSATRGLTPDIVTAAQALSDEMTGGKNLLFPLDAYLAKAEKP
jgi:uncharacterized protein